MKIQYISKVDFSKQEKENVFLYLNLSVLSGEYLIDKNSFFKEINKSTQSEIDTLLSSSEESTKDSISENVADSKTKKNETKIFIKAIENYKKLAKITNDNLDFQLQTEIQKDDFYTQKINVESEIDKLFFDIIDNEFSEDDNIKLFYLIFLLNLRLSELDEYLDSSKGCIDELEKVYDYLDRLQQYIDKWNKQVLNILLDKTDFLILKVKSRKNKNIILEHKSVFEQNKYFSFFETLASHYDISEDKNGNNEFIDSKFTAKSNYKEIDIEVVENIHHFNKFIKKTTLLNCAGKVENLKGLSKRIDTEIINKSESIKNFNKFSYISAQNLIKNTELYLMLNEEETLDYKNICGEDFYKKDVFSAINPFKSKILNNLDRNYNDYRGYELVIDFLDKLVDKFENPEDFFPFFTDDTIDEITINHYKRNIKNNFQSLKEFYKDILEKFEENKDKHLMFDLKPIYLNFDECVKEVEVVIPTTENDETLKFPLFIDSSYILPINYEKINNKILETKQTYNFKLNQYKEKTEILFNFNLTKRAKEDFEKKVRENEFKVVQIVAMFVSIATFVLINVKIFDNKTGSESFGVLLSLAGIFLLFNSFFKWLITNQLYKIKDILSDYFLWVPILLIVTGSYFIFNSEGDSIIKKIEGIFNTKIDSTINVRTRKYESLQMRDSINRILKDENVIKRIETLENKK